MSAKIDEKILDQIIDKMVSTVSNSKQEIFEIAENSRKEFEQLRKELDETKKQVNVTIDEGDKLESQVRHARLRLTEVSRQFKKYSEEEIREAYEKAHNLQMHLSMLRQTEKQLRERRDELERRLKDLGKTVERAENLVGQISVVLNYLTNDLQVVNEVLADARQKQEFGLRIIEAQEEERRRLSREIHDGPAQMLANVMMRSDLIDRIFREKGTEQGLKEIRDLRKNVRDALYEVRKIIYDLRPMALDDLGLLPTLKKYLETVKDYYDTEIKFTNLGKTKRFSQRLEVALFRLVQEGVQNACKHANAKVIQVKVDFGKKDGYIVIKDDGKGFNPDEKKENSFGLMGMKERIDLLDGEMSIDTKINVGTVITLRVPLQEQN